MKRAKILLRGLAALIVMLISVSCNTKSENESFNQAIGWVSKEYFASKSSSNYEHIRLFFTPHGKFYPLGEVYDMHRFRHYEWTGDSLILSNDKGMKAYYHILSYNDSSFVIADYPEYGDTLHFEKDYYLSSYTMQEWQNKGYLSAFDYPDDSLDIILENTNQSLPDNSKGIILSKQQMIKARNILKEYYNRGYLELLYSEGVSVRLGYPLDLYFRRYIGYKQRGHMKVLIALDNKLNDWDNAKIYSDIKNSEIPLQTDGGSGIGEVYIDLDENKVEWLYIHGEA